MQGYDVMQFSKLNKFVTNFKMENGEGNENGFLKMISLGFLKYYNTQLLRPIKFSRIF